MSMPNFLTTNRRGFVGALAALGLQQLFAGDVFAQTQAPSDAWLDGMKGKHKLFFDVPEPDGGTALRHAHGYLDGWRDAYGVAERDVNLVVGLYGRATPWGVTDAMWEKYKLGSALGLTDSTTNAPPVRNWFAHLKPGDPVGDGTPASSIEALQARGVTFLLCNNALQRWSGRLEKSGLGSAKDIHADLSTHALPGVAIVPNVLVSMTKAFERGFGSVRT